MKKYVQYSLAFLGLGALITPPVHALIGPALTTGGSSSQTFATAVLSRSYHKPSGTLFVGLTGSTSTDQNVLCYATRTGSTDTAPTFTGIGGSSVLSGNRIQHLQVIQNPAARSDVSTAYVLTTTGTSATTLLCLTPTAQNNAPQVAALSAALTFTVAGGVYSSVGYGFAAVKAQGSATTNFGAAATDGVAIAKIDATTLAMTTSILAVPVTTGYYSAGAVPTATGSPSLVYDETLGKVYVAAGQLVSGTAFNNAICNVLMFTIADTPTLTNVSFAGTLSTTMSFSSIVGSRVNGSGAVTNSINRMRIMHTSTAPAAGTTNYAYLIVNGGAGASTATGNKVYAAPLVVNNATAANNGKLASIGTQTTYPFDTPVSAVGDLYTTASVQAVVGNGDLPMAASGTIADMWVDGDAVYCSISGAATATNCPGVWKSQAMFDQLGRIAYWTDWELVTPEGYTATGSNLQTAVTNFAVDAYTGQIWGINNAGTNLYLTSWNNTAVATGGLVGFLNSNLDDGCFSVLDMNSSVTGWGASTSIRMALFGGLNTVCFAMTGSAVYGLGANSSTKLAFGPSNTSSLTNTATVVLTDAYLNTLNDYTATSTNIGLVTTGLSGRVKCLGYSGWTALNASNDKPGFFLAGVQPEAAEDGGLYAYASSTGAGFDPAQDITDLKNGFFASSNSNSWQELSNVVGTPVKILSRGGALYVLTQSVDDEGDRTDYIYRATICDTVTNLNNSFVAIATSGLAPSGTDSSLASVSRIYDFVISATAGGTTIVPTGAEQLLMLTDDGIYTTTCANGTETDFGTVTATSLQLNAGWTQIADSDTYIEMMMSEPDRQRNPRTYWFSSFVPNSTTSYYTSQVMNQLNSNYTTFSGTFQSNPSTSKAGVFDSDSTTSFTTLPLMRNIYSDGSRRFFVQASDINQHYLVALPYSVGTSAWNVMDPQSPINSSALAGAKAFYWIAQVGPSGKLMVGTDNGVASLE